MIKLNIMKKLSFITAILSVIFITAICPLSAQKTKQEKKAEKEAAIKALMDAQHFDFEAQTAVPVGMKTRQLTSAYEVRVRKDTIESYLPYFGKAYTAPISSSDAGIQFKTTDFKYISKEGKKGGWDITIDLKKAGDTRSMIFYISADGYATLQVMSNNRQSISFYGSIK
jgi:hypothetical protein